MCYSYNFAAQMEQETQILNKAKELFFKLGVRSITMDDLSRELGISKKTLYQYVENKSDLVNKTLRLHFTEEQQVIANCIAEAENANDQMRRIASERVKNCRSMHPSSIYDIQKYHPGGWKIISEFKSEFIYQCILENIAKGKKEGMYRPTVDEDVVAKLYINAIDYLVSPQYFPSVNYNFSNLYKEFITYHLYGIATDKGFKYLQNAQLEPNE